MFLCGIFSLMTASFTAADISFGLIYKLQWKATQMWGHKTSFPIPVRKCCLCINFLNNQYNFFCETLWIKSWKSAISLHFSHILTWSWCLLKTIRKCIFLQSAYMVPLSSPRRLLSVVPLTVPVVPSCQRRQWPGLLVTYPQRLHLSPWNGSPLLGPCRGHGHPHLSHTPKAKLARLHHWSGN